MGTNVEKTASGFQTSGAKRATIAWTDRVAFLRSDEIDWLEAARNYVCVHGGGNSSLFRASMNSVERSLDARTFARIHRSTIVNIDRIRKVTPRSRGEYVVTMHDGTRLRASRSYSYRLNAFIEAHGVSVVSRDDRVESSRAPLTNQYQAAFPENV